MPPKSRFAFRVFSDVFESFMLCAYPVLTIAVKTSNRKNGFIRQTNPFGKFYISNEMMIPTIVGIETESDSRIVGGKLNIACK